VHYYLGRAHEARGDAAAAYEAYWKHIEMTQRMITRDLNEIIVEVCDEEGVPWIDGAKSIESAAEGGLTGYDLFIDGMHPNAKAHAILGSAFADKYLSILRARQTTP
jgi:lysophospholipase L1-like esterase